MAYQQLSKEELTKILDERNLTGRVGCIRKSWINQDVCLGFLDFCLDNQLTFVFVVVSGLQIINTLYERIDQLDSDGSGEEIRDVELKVNEPESLVPELRNSNTKVFLAFEQELLNAPLREAYQASAFFFSSMLQRAKNFQRHYPESYFDTNSGQPAEFEMKTEDLFEESEEIEALGMGNLFFFLCTKSFRKCGAAASEKKIFNMKQMTNTNYTKKGEESNSPKKDTGVPSNG